MCVVWVCAMCVGVLLVCLGCVCWCALLVCGCVCGVAHSQDHGKHIQMDVHVGVTPFAQFSEEECSLEHLVSMMSVFRRPSTMVSCFLLLVAVSKDFNMKPL